jgi:hypothetical protein
MYSSAITDVTMFAVKRTAHGAQDSTFCRLNELDAVKSAYDAMKTAVKTTCITSIHDPSPGRMATTHLLARTMAMDIREKREATLMPKKVYGFCVGAGGEPTRAA